MQQIKPLADINIDMSGSNKKSHLASFVILSSVMWLSQRETNAKIRSKLETRVVRWIKEKFRFIYILTRLPCNLRSVLVDRIYSHSNCIMCKRDRMLYQYLPFLIDIIFLFFPTDNRTIELYSPDGVHSLILKATTPTQCQAWVNGLSSTLSESTESALVRANRSLHEVLEGKARFMGWLLKRNPSDTSTSNSLKVSSRGPTFSLYSLY